MSNTVITLKKTFLSQEKIFGTRSKELREKKFCLFGIAHTPWSNVFQSNCFDYK